MEIKQIYKPLHVILNTLFWHLLLPDYKHSFHKYLLNTYYAPDILVALAMHSLPLT